MPQQGGVLIRYRATANDTGVYYESMRQNDVPCIFTALELPFNATVHQIVDKIDARIKKLTQAATRENTRVANRQPLPANYFKMFAELLGPKELNWQYMLPITAGAWSSFIKMLGQGKFPLHPGFEIGLFGGSWAPPFASLGALWDPQERERERERLCCMC